MRKTLLLLVLALGALAADGAVAEAAPVRALVPGVSPVTALGRPVRYGPYATLRRANAVARYLRLRGYNARVVYLGSLALGTRRYAVNVWV
jgi:hypothetical protein